jgi:8-oxo-dGTP pyrophosphatase MutT (NUDIX family)
MEGQNRFHCVFCKKIHYENPKPTATLICVNENKLLLVKRAVEPAKGCWGLPGGFIELGETPNEGAIRELKEETNLDGKPIWLLGYCSNHNTIFGDVLLLGIEMEIGVKWRQGMMHLRQRYLN